MKKHHRRSAGMAECEQCDDLAVDATRDEAMQHAADRGHLVHFIIEDASTYDGRKTT